MPRMPRTRLLSLAIATLLLQAASAQTVGWRGDGTGRYPQASVPLQWSADRNVLWRCPLPATGNATPLVVGDRIFVTAEPFSLLCVGADGQVRWQADSDLLATLPEAEAAALRARLDASDQTFQALQAMQNERRQLQRRARRDRDDVALQQEIAALDEKIAAAQVELEPLDEYRPPITHHTNGYASPTPASDGRHVWAVFGNGVASCFDIDGRRLWSRRVARPSHQWGHSSSPLLVDGTLVVHIVDLHGLDPHTGQERWRVASKQRWGSPVAVRLGDTAALISANGEVVRARDGQVLHRGLGKLEYATPVIHGGVLYLIENDACAFRVPEDPTAAFEPLWSARIEGDRHYASPLIHDGLVYAVSRREHLTVLDAATGAIVHEQPMKLGGNMPNSVYPSVTLVGDRILVSSENGNTAVLAPGRAYRELARNAMPGFRGSPVAVGDRLYLRCYDALFCISDARRAAVD